MSLRNVKFSLGLFVLVAYASMGVFGLLQSSHMSEMPMDVCPYEPAGHSICKTDLDHINNWRQLSSATFPPLWVLSLLALGIFLHFYNQQNFLNNKGYFYRWKYYLDHRKLYNYLEEIIKWLSLFENSPSFAHKA